MKTHSIRNHALRFLFIAVFTATSVQAQSSGVLDPAFNPNVAGGSGIVFATSVQPDGKLIIGGNFTAVGGVARSNIARLHADGSLDTTFTASTNSDVFCIAVQSDGKLVIGGLFTSVNGTSGSSRIARLNPDGSRDPTFNASLVGDSLGPLRCVALQADGKLVIGGSFTTVNGVTGVNRITRLNPDGSRDTDFNSGLGGTNSTVYSVAVQADGKIVIVGNFSVVNGALGVNRVARLHPDGSRDTTFNVGGVNSDVYSVAIQADDKLVIGGFFTSVNGRPVSTTGGVNRIARLNQDGTLDAGFNTGLGGADSTVISVALQADGKLLLGGHFSKMNGTTRLRIARLIEDGTLDPAFNASVSGTDVPGDTGRPYSVAVQADGEVVLGGNFTSVNGTTRNRVARLSNDAATQSLSVADTAQVRWERGGAGPEVHAVTFEQSTNGGSTWTLLGSGNRVRGTSNWQLTGLSLPANVQIRARGRTISGYFNGGSGLIEQVASFSGLMPPALTVTSVIPAIGSIGGGTIVTIIGTNFTGATEVTFGGAASTSFSVDSATQITATTPAGISGPSDVRVTIPNGTNAANTLYTYEAPPTVAAVFPASGNPAGGDSIAITGTSFARATAVSFGGVPAPSFTVNSPTQITVTTPPGSGGPVSVLVTTPSGTSALNSIFTYIPPPTVTAVTPHNGSTLYGRTDVTITGTNFTSVTFVTFAGKAASSFTVNSSTQITALPPTGSPGPASVLVTTPSGTNMANTLFTYVAQPVISAVSPAAGSTLGGTVVTLTGDHLNGATAVTFGGATATSFTVDSQTQITATTPPRNHPGAVSVLVTTAGGTNWERWFTYVSPPTISAVTPATGSTIGGSVVTITGTNLSGASSVSFGGTAATSFTVDSSTQITATTPAGSAGTVSVLVTTSGGTTAANTLFTYVLPPTISAVTPAIGSTLGGTVVTITGTNFNGATAVSFKGAVATSFTVNSSTQITATTPAGAVGAASVLVTTPGNTNAANTLFAYVPPPTVTAVSPSAGSTLGGTVVTITGTNFNGATAVSFGGAAATSFTLNSPTRITATTPSGSTGAFSVLVTTPGGINAANLLFTYVAPPTIAAVSPATGSTLGGTVVTLNGANLTGATAVRFGDLPATSFAVNSTNQITATTPPSTAGAASVSVTTVGGLNVASTPYTYAVSPSINAVAPSTGSTMGGTVVTISGSNLSGATAVTFGGTAATSFTMDSASQITATTPAGTLGSASVRVTTPGETNAANTLYTYVFRAEPNKTGKQALVFTPPVRVNLEQSPLILSASSSSGLPIAYTVISGPATVTGNVLTLTGPGVVKVRASQPGNVNFLAASVQRSIKVVPNPTALTLANLSQTYTGTPRPISVLGTTGNVSVTYKVNSNFVSEPPINVGSYLVTVVAGTITRTGILTINKAPLWVLPDDQRKLVGQPNPELTLTYLGFQGSDSATNSVSKAPVLRTTAKTTSLGGFYPITASRGISANYQLIYLRGTILVETFAASYEALLVDMDTQRPNAKLELTVAANSKAFSAKLTTPRETRAVGLRGTLDTNADNETVTGTAAIRRDTITYFVNVTLPIKGSFSAEANVNGVTLGSTASGSKLLRLAKGQTLSYRGAHSAQMSPAAGGTDVPTGAGWAVATINARGVLNLIGKLADGTVLTASLAADVSDPPGYRLFVQPYRRASTGSFVAGSFALKPHPVLTDRRLVAYEDDADLTWVKAQRTRDASYRDGFGPVDTRFTLDPWLPPAPAKRNLPAITLAQRLGLIGPENQFTVQHSPFSSLSFDSLPTTLALNAASNKVRLLAPLTTPANATKWKVTLTPKTGVFVGSFELNDSGKKRVVRFNGILRQPASNADTIIGNGSFQVPTLTPAPNTDILSGEVLFER